MAYNVYISFNSPYGEDEMLKKLKANWPVILFWIALAAGAALLTGIPYEMGFGWQIVAWAFIGVPIATCALIVIPTLIYAFAKGNFPEMHGENPFRFR